MKTSHGRKPPSDHPRSGKESKSTFVRKSVDFYDAPGCFEEPNMVLMAGQERHHEPDKIHPRMPPAGKVFKERKCRAKAQLHGHATVPPQRSRYEKKAKRYRDKVQSSNATSEGVVAESMVKSSRRKCTRYRDKMNKHSNKEQEPLGDPSNPVQYFGVREPPNLYEESSESSSLEQESIGEELEPGAVAMSFDGGPRRLQKGRLTVLCGGLDDDSVLVARCERGDGFEDEITSSSKPKMWCGIRRVLVILVLALVTIAIATAVPLSLRRTPAATEESPVDTNTTERATTNSTLRREALRAVITKFTDTAMLDEEGSPQHEAFEWLVTKDTLSPMHNSTIGQESRVLQRYALSVVFFYAFGYQMLLPGEHECWTVFSGNLVDITCDIFEAVLGITILSPRVAPDGSLPSEIDLLSSIRDLHVSLGFDAIPTTVGLLTNLIFLNLPNSNIGGSIPSELGLLSNLELMWLDSNEITGRIPTEVGLLTKMTTLDLSVNVLTGEIPTVFNSMTNLDQLYLYNNSFTGEFECPDFIDRCYISCLDYGNVTCRSL